MSDRSVKKASEYAALALERIKKEGLAPFPENYELWYVYYAQSNPDVTRAIDIMETSSQKLTDDRCHELHQKFLGNSQQSERVREAGDKIQETIKTVSSAVKQAKDATSDYNDTLGGATEKLTMDMTQEDLEKILQEIITNTESIMAKNAELEGELDKSSEAMEDLQRDLELVRKEALTDGLTGLCNRKSFDAELTHLINDAAAEPHALTLVMMDIDHFKSFNDNYGHQVGDQVLKLVARTLVDGVKGRDVAARFGGEEFAIILPNTNLQAGLTVSDYLRKAVASKDVINRNTGEKMGRITLSGGVAEYIQGESSEDLIERADAALYTAKHNGRNQVAAATPPGQKKEKEA